MMFVTSPSRVTWKSDGNFSLSFRPVPELNEPKISPEPENKQV